MASHPFSTAVESASESYTWMPYAPHTLQQALDRAAAVFSIKPDFDSLLGRGLSGAAFVPALALRLNKPFALLRKGDEQAHSSRFGGYIGKRVVIVDDFVATGATVRKMQGAAMREGARIAGVYLYQSHGGYIQSDVSHAADFWIAGGRFLGEATDEFIKAAERRYSR